MADFFRVRMISLDIYTIQSSCAVKVFSVKLYLYVIKLPDFHT